MHNLHGPDRLFETRYGHVLQCACCGRFQVVFRDHTLLVDDSELGILCETVRYALRKLEVEGQEKWRLKIDTDAGPVAVLLTEPSLRALHALLQGAWSMHALQRRTQAVQSGDETEARTVLRDHAPAAGVQSRSLRSGRPRW
jgi:hypothetical protein